MPGKHNYKKMAEGGRADMSAKPDIAKPEPEKAIAPPTPMSSAMELSNVKRKKKKKAKKTYGKSYNY